MRMAAFLLAFLLQACQHPGTEVPAVLADEAAVLLAKERVSAALGREGLAYGPTDPAETPVLVVLPPRPGPHEGRSPGVPRRFDILLAEGACRLSERGGTLSIELPEGSCRPL